MCFQRPVCQKPSAYFLTNVFMVIHNKLAPDLMISILNALYINYQRIIDYRRKLKHGT